MIHGPRQSRSGTFQSAVKSEGFWQRKGTGRVIVHAASPLCCRGIEARLGIIYSGAARIGKPLQSGWSGFVYDAYLLCGYLQH